jgi:N-acetylglucosamine-6-sulfatase
MDTRHLLRGRQLLTAAVAAAVAVAGTQSVSTPSEAVVRAGTATDDSRPSVVLVLLDDMSTELLRTMRSALRMRAEGAAYPHSYVVDSLCCVSRASTFTGQYPHQTGVRLNVSVRDADDPMGGWPAFVKHGNLERTVAGRLRGAGYTTGYVGKYLNEYEYRPGRKVPPPVPGWDELTAVFYSAYDGWDFWSGSLDEGAMEVRHHPAPPASDPRKLKDRAYAGRFIERTALRFVREHEAEAEPYFLQVAPYAPHGRVHKSGHYPGDPFFPAAFRDRPRPQRPYGNCGAVSCRSLTLRDLPGYGDARADNRPFRRNGRPGDRWNRRESRLAAEKAVALLRGRAQMLQSADRMLRRLLNQVGQDTYVILTSDNGFHLGQHGLGAGKGTAYTTDIRVPMLVVGPGVRPGLRRELVSNIDLAPTLERIAGLEPALYRAGRSLLPSLARPRLRERDYVFVEHTWGRKRPGDPDTDTRDLDDIPSYVGVRSRTRLLVRYDLDRSAAERFVYEFYDLTRQRFERRNQFSDPGFRGAVAKMLDQLRWFDACSPATRDDIFPAGCRSLGRPLTRPGAWSA